MQAKNIKIVGLSLFAIAMGVFTIAFFLSEHTLHPNLVKTKISNLDHQEAFLATATEQGLMGKTFSSNIQFVNALKPALKKAQKKLYENWEAKKAPEGADEWTYKMGDYFVGDYTYQLTKASSSGGLVTENSGLFFWLSIILGSIGALIYFIPDLRLIPGIKNNGIYHHAATRGVKWNIRLVLLLGVGLFAFSYALGQVVWLLIGLLASIGIILFSIFQGERSHQGVAPRSASPAINGWLGIATGVYLICFYIMLYWYPEYTINWALLVSPIKQLITGNPDAEASQWFLYGFLYCIVMLVMGVRMLIKYRHNRYQMIRTASVLFFQLAFAFMIPEIMSSLNNPWMDLKTAWPLDYDMFTAGELTKFRGQGNELMGFKIGTMMLIWGVILSFIIVPVFTYFYGKRWYCSWVCGCGGLAETMGDPYRQLSDKSLRAWRIERYLVHGVLAFAVLMTIIVFYHYVTGNQRILMFQADSVKAWYGFLIGSTFSGVVGTGFYPMMGNRVWCRFGCPLAAIMGIVQKFKSRFRITVNGGQCISCGNCSTYCEMGIDVRHYAQRGQNIVRASCVGCGVCAAVCPRGVLRLENSSEDVNTRTTELRTLHITDDIIKMDVD